MAIALEVTQKGITKLDVDAITNAANSKLQNIGGVALVIAKAGGQALEDECRKLAPIGLGEAVATTAGDMLPQPRWVIHASTMLNPGGKTSAKVVDKATRSTLACAEELGAKSVGLVAFGTGVGGFPLDDAAQIMVAAAQEHQAVSLDRIVFSVRGNDAEKAFTAAVDAA